jgi:mgtE-like transporter
MGLGSHLRRNPVVRNSVLAAFIIGISACIFVGIMVWIAGAALGIGVPFITIMSLCLIAGTFELMVVLSATIAIAFASHRFGIDPDDTVIPLIATLGDLVGVIGIFVTMYILNLI